MNPEDDDRTLIRPTRAPLATPTSTVPTEAAKTAAAPAAPSATVQTFQATALLTSATAASSPGVGGHPNTLLPGTRLLEFEIRETVGEGGFGIVYAAWDHSLDRRVALKEYMPSSLASRSGQSQILPRSERHRETFEAGLKSFVNEAKMLAQFDHPSLLKVYRFWEANGTAYMVMPFLEGATVRDAVRGLAEPPDEAWIRGLLTPLFDALAMLHAAQIYHRDIAPDNIHLLADTGRPLLLDFGAARRVIGDMTQALTAILKPGYAPVEQYADIPGLKQGPWTDVYALAAVVHWIVTGKTPPPSVGRMFDDAHVPLAQRAAGRYSPAFLEAIDRALAVMPDKRTQTIEAFRNDLLGLPADQAATVAAGPATALPQTRGPATVATTRRAAASDMPVPTLGAGPATRTTGPLTRQEPTQQAQSARVTDAAPQAAAPGSTAAPGARGQRRVVAGVIVATLALLGVGGYLLARRGPAPPVVDATTTASPKPAGTPAPAVVPKPVPLPVAASGAPASIELAPAVSDTPATTSPSTLPTAQSPTPEPAPATADKESPSAPPGVSAATTQPQTGGNPPRPASRRAAEPRVERREAPAAAEPHAVDPNKAECARLFQRLSMGEAGPELIERVRTLRCR